MRQEPKNPRRWCKFMLCRTAEVRLAVAVSDLHAADTRYHDDCRKKFTSKRNVESLSKESVEQVDHAFDVTVSGITSDKLRICSSVEVFSTYTGNDGSLLSRASLVQRLNEFFAGELIELSSPVLKCTSSCRF